MIRFLFVATLTLGAGQPPETPPPTAMEQFFSTIRPESAPERSPANPPPSQSPESAAAPTQPAQTPAAPPKQLDPETVYRTWKSNQLPPVDGSPELLILNYNRKDVPSVTVLPGYSTDIALEPGETIHTHLWGDPEGFLSTETLEGVQNPTAHLFIRPVLFDLSTNLIIVTDRRTYRLAVRSPKRDPDSATPYHVAVKFNYPMQWARESRDRAANESARARRIQEATVGPEPLGSALHFDYQLTNPTKKRKQFPWRPTAIFDDGERTFLHLPPNVHQQDLGILLGKLESGETYPLNTSVQGRYLVVGAIFERAILATGVGKHRRHLTIRRLP